MAYLQSLCLMVLATLVACQGQCIIRTLMPSMAVMDCPPGSSGCSGSCADSSSFADDLGTLLHLVRALEIDRANNANSGIDVNGLLNSLIHAIVSIAKPDSGSSGNNGYSSGFPNDQTTSSNGMNSGRPNTGNTGHSRPTPGPGSSGSPGVSGILGTVTDTVGGLLDGSSAGGVPAILNSVTGTVSQLVGGGSGLSGLVDGLGNTVEGLGNGGGGSGSSGLGGATGLVGGSKGGLL